MQESKQTKRRNGNIITTWTMGVLAFILLPLMPVEAVAQSGSCNSNISVNISGPAKPWYTGDRLTASARFTAWPSTNSTYVDIPDFGYAMACKPLEEMIPPAAEGEGVTYHNCQWSGHESKYLAGIVVGDGCVNDLNQKILFPPPESQFIDFRPLNGPIRVAEGKSCTISWDFEVESVPEGEYDLLQVVSFPLDPENSPASCESGISTQQSREVHVMVAEPDPQIELTKSADPIVYGSVGQKIVYSYDVKNIGNDTLDFIEAVTDAHIPNPDDINCSWPGVEFVLLRGETVSCDVDYFVTQTDLDRGFIYNQAFTEAIGRALGKKVEDDDDVTINAVRNPSMNLVKTVTNSGTGAGGAFKAGETITYGMTVTNTGNVTLTNVTIDDPIAGLSDVSCSVSLAPAASCSVNTGSYLVTQADINNNGGGDGDIDNTATASSDQTPDDTSSAAAPLIDSLASMNLVKTVTNSGTGAGGKFRAGDTVTYGMTLTNTGSVTLTNVTIDDPVAGLSDVSCSVSLVPAASCTVDTGSYLVTQADINNNGGGDGDIDNTATASSDQTPDDTSSAAAPLIDSLASMNLVKTVTNSGTGTGGAFKAGETITYGMTVTNTGNVTLTNVTIDDPVAGLSDASCSVSLVPAASCTVDTGSYLVTQTDIDNNGGGDGDIDNTATASSDQTPDDTSSAEAPLVSTGPAMNLVKTVTNSGTGAGGAFKAGETITYGMTVTNTGNVTLTNVTIDDPVAGLSDASCSVSLVPAASCTVDTGSYLVTQTDIDNNGGGDGDIDNTATASSDQTPDDTSSAEAPLVSTGPAMNLVKTVTNSGTGAGGAFKAGETITYGMTVTNTGNVTLTNVTIDDPVAGLSDASCSVSLVPAASCTVDTGSYLVTQTDIDNNGGGDGDIDNTATASSDQTPDDTSSAEAPLVSTGPAMNLVKTVTNSGTGAGGAFKAGETITYGMTVTNTGNVTLTNVTIDDPVAGLSDVSCSVSLVPAASCTVDTGSYLVTQTDIDNNGGGDGDIDNTATASSDQTPDDTSSAEAPLVSTGPAMNLVKTVTNSGTGTGGAFKAGDTITYGMTVTNTGAVTLTNVTIDDPVAGLSDASCSVSLVPAASCTVDTGSYLVTQTDINNNGGGDGDIDNTATASSDQTPDDTSSAEAPLIAQDPKFEIAKDISIDDGASWQPVTAGPVPWPSGALYRITVTNTGNVDLPSVIVSDKFPGLPEDVYGDIGPLLVGESVVITPDGSGDLVWTALDVETVCEGQESVTNIASAVAAWDPAPITRTNDATLVCDKPAILLVKEVGMPDPDNAGQYLWFDANVEPFPLANYDPPNSVDVKYRFWISNISVEEVDLENVVVTDTDIGFTSANIPLLEWAAVPVPVLIDNVPVFTDRCGGGPGDKTNVATAAGVSEFGTPVSDDDPATVRCVNAPAIMVTKQVSANGSIWSDSSASGIATSDAYFRFIITNIGDAPLDSLSANDGILTISTGASLPNPLDGITLAPGESITLVPGTPGPDQVYWEDLYLAGQGYCNSDFSIENSVTVTGASTITGQEVNDNDTATFNCTEEEDPEICYDEGTGKPDEKPYWIKLRYDADSDSSITMGANPTTPIINGIQWSNGDPTPLPASFPASVDIFLFQHNGSKRIYWSKWLNRTTVNNVLYIAEMPKLVPPTTLIEIYSQCETNVVGGTQDPDLGCGEPIQTIEFHTSCSQDLISGDEFGAITLVSGGHEPLQN